MAQETSLRETMAESQLRTLDEAGLLGLLTAEIINGELVVRGTPTVRHQQIVARLLVAVSQWAHEHGGDALPGDVGVEVDRDRQVRPTWCSSPPPAGTSSSGPELTPRHGQRFGAPPPACPLPDGTPKPRVGAYPPVDSRTRTGSRRCVTGEVSR